MRGWLHLFMASVSTAAIASGRHGLSPAPVLHFAVVTFVFPYWCSVGLHFIPWRKRTAHDLALVFDFMGISIGYSGQTVSWVGAGWRDPGELSAVAWAARINVLSTVVLATILAVGWARRKHQPVMLHARGWRFAIMIINMVLLGFVECSTVRDAWVNAFIQVLGKVIVPWYFVTCVAVDAKSKSPLPLWPGVWSAHEYWHTFILVLHLVQFYALGTHYGTWTWTFGG